MFKFKTAFFTIFSIFLISLMSCGTTKSAKEHIIIDTTPADSKPFEGIEILPKKDVPVVVVDTTPVPQPEIKKTETKDKNEPAAEINVAEESENIPVNAENTGDETAESTEVLTETTASEEGQLPAAAETEEEPAEKVDSNDILSTPVEIEETETFVEPAVQDAEEVFEEAPTMPADADEEDFSFNTEAETPLPEVPVVSAPEAPVKKDSATVKTTETIKNADTASSKVTTTKIEQKQTVQEQKEKTPEQPVVQTSTNNVDVFKNLAVIEPSRSMKVKRNQFVDVVYPGNGWIYIGETETDPKFRYFGRKLGTENTVFTLRSIKAGKTYLHFYKNDVLTAQYIDDYLEVEVVNETAKNNEKATAPSYAEVVPPKPVRGVTTIEAEVTEAPAQEQSIPQLPYKKTSTVKGQEEPKKEQAPSQQTADDSRVKTIIQNTEEGPDSSSENLAPVLTTPQSPVSSAESNTNTSVQEEKAPLVINTDPSKSLLDQAKSSLKNKQYELALAQIRAYLDTSSLKLDEAYYVQGQILEADSEVRNIRSAIDSYDTVIKKYPASKFWNQANKRKIFLNRFYINIY